MRGVAPWAAGSDKRYRSVSRVPGTEGLAVGDAPACSVSGAMLATSQSGSSDTSSASQRLSIPSGECSTSRRYSVALSRTGFTGGSMCASGRARQHSSATVVHETAGARFVGSDPMAIDLAIDRSGRFVYAVTSSKRCVDCQLLRVLGNAFIGRSGPSRMILTSCPCRGDL